MSTFTINAGHTLSGKGTGAVGFINESKENRIVTNHVIRLLKALGHVVIDCTIDKSNNYLKDAVGASNKHKADLAISIHFNSSKNESANGVETLVYNPKDSYTTKYANAINKEIALLGYKNRGIKQRQDLSWLRDTTSKAILIECCFVSNESDTNKYNAVKMAEAIVKGLVGKLPATTSNNASDALNNTINTSNKLYAVCVGAYSYDNAKKIQQEVIKKGYKDAYLIAR
jgi:N-acetylmuramoyl-L-alanine amidase